MVEIDGVFVVEEVVVFRKNVVVVVDTAVALERFEKEVTWFEVIAAVFVVVVVVVQVILVDVVVEFGRRSLER